MAMFSVCYVALALSGLCWADGDKPLRPPGCDAIEPLNRTESFDYYDRVAPVISRYFQNRSSIGIAWTSDTKDDPYADDLCGFTVHWFQERSPTKHWHIEIKDPDENSHLFQDLQPGTKYIYYVVAYYTTQHEPRSWKLTTYTDGCGPDVPDFCDAKGSEQCNEVTGSCICKTIQTLGDKCDSCPNGFYMHPLGCTTCDHCANDTYTSTGNCKPAKDSGDTMTCDCIHPYTGKHCRECSEGFFLDEGGICSPCRCPEGKEEDSHLTSCDPLTGKCDCPKDRSGHNCEKCADGYFGNPLTDGCIHTRNVGVTALIVIVVLIIVAVAAVSTYLVCRRRIAERVRMGFFRAHLREDYDKVNFTTLEEEPEFEPGRVKPLSA